MEEITRICEYKLLKSEGWGRRNFKSNAIEEIETIETWKQNKKA